MTLNFGFLCDRQAIDYSTHKEFAIHNSQKS